MHMFLDVYMCVDTIFSCR